MKTYKVIFSKKDQIFKYSVKASNHEEALMQVLEDEKAFKAFNYEITVKQVSLLHSIRSILLWPFYKLTIYAYIAMDKAFFSTITEYPTICKMACSIYDALDKLEQWFYWHRH